MIPPSINDGDRLIDVMRPHKKSTNAKMVANLFDHLTLAKSKNLISKVFTYIGFTQHQIYQNDCGGCCCGV